MYLDLYIFQDLGDKFTNQCGDISAHANSFTSFKLPLISAQLLQEFSISRNLLYCIQQRYVTCTFLNVSKISFSASSIFCWKLLMEEMEEGYVASL